MDFEINNFKNIFLVIFLKCLSNIFNNYKISSILFFIKDYSSNESYFKKLPKHENLEEINCSLSYLIARIKKQKFYNIAINNFKDFYFFSETTFLNKNFISWNDLLFTYDDFLIIKTHSPLIQVNSKRLGLKLIAKVSQQGKKVFSPVKKVNFI
uniref:Uncharacterized protein n=1 Tax=Phacus orbicularis TaxID=158829 RepID=A0A182B0Y4_9EUGL|nr:hypothetical protein [Phacus orbicularis]